MAGRSIDLNVTISGPLFSKRIDPVVKRAIVEEALEKIEERMVRSARSGGVNALGRRRNVVTQRRQNLDLHIESTLRNPRQTGRAWGDKNMAIIKAMTRNVLNKATQRIVGELS